MNLSEYQRLAARTIPVEEIDSLLTNFCLGLAGEGGELIDHVKKAVFHKHALDKDYLAKELGDLLWYIAGISSILKLDLSDIGDINIDKLKRRYPNGFTTHHSVHREEELDINDMIKKRQVALLEIIGSVNTTVTEGDAVVGAFLDIDQGYVELEDGSGYRMSMGPVTKSEMRSVKKRLNLEE